MPLLSRRRSAREIRHAPVSSDRAFDGDPNFHDRSLPLPTVEQSRRLDFSTAQLSPDFRRHAEPPQHRPVSEHGYQNRSRLSHELHANEIPDHGSSPPSEPPPTEPPTRAKRFSLMKLRNFSESHLNTRTKSSPEVAEESDLPNFDPADNGRLPAIVKTAPTMLLQEPAESNPVHASRQPEKYQTRPSLLAKSPSRPHSSHARTSQLAIPDDAAHDSNRLKRHSMRWRSNGRNTGLDDLHRLSAMHLQPNQAPPIYGDDTNSALALPATHIATPRFSESSRSDQSNGSSGDGPIYGSTTTTTTTTHTTFFRLPRRNKNRNSLFPLPMKVPPQLEDSRALQHQDRQHTSSSPLSSPSARHQAGREVGQDQSKDGTLSPPPMPSQSHSSPATPRPSTSAFSTRSCNTDGAVQSEMVQQLGSSPLQRRHTETTPTKRRTRQHSIVALPTPKNSLSFAEPSMSIFGQRPSRSNSSITSSPIQGPLNFASRARSSTASSFGQISQDTDTPPPLSASGRNSTSTTGRSSFGGLLHLSRFRQGSEPHSPRHGSPGTRSKSNSFAISRDPVLPEREEGDTPGKYLERLEAAVSRGLIAGLLSKSADPFAQAVLRSYTRRFSFFGEPIDMSLRKLLLEAELPKETQQVDRVIQAFADRYHECNPGIFIAPDQAYIIAFSLMMLHTDAFNKNNKRKMQKADYIKNTSGQGPSDDILGCFYDNICYTPFVHYEEEVDINGERVLPFKTKRSMGKLRAGLPGVDSGVGGKKLAGPVDPYNLLVDAKLDHLRPTIKDTIAMEDPYNYLGGQNGLDLAYLQRAFTHTGVLQIISARSRPAAYERQLSDGQPSPTETQQGIVDLKVTKVGILWRKAAKRKKARSPWQEWGAILTGSQLYLFKNSHWAKGLMHQFNSQQKHGQPRTPVTFKPPLHEFKPDALIKTDNAVALVDASYTRHKHAFTFVRPGGQEEVLLADNEGELNDWLGLINYAAAFRAAGVRIRGMLGISEEDTRSRELKRLNSTKSVRSARMSMEEATAQNRTLSPQLQKQVMAARRQIMAQRISEMETEIIDAVRQLENMLRNARHLHVLAPIATKTREDVVNSAARADMMIQWLRRDIWRMKCHRDILAMDVRLDGLGANELDKLAAPSDTPAPHQQVSDSDGTSRKEKPNLLTRLSSSRNSAAAAVSSPQSPQVIASTSKTSLAGAAMPSGDVFHTPMEAPQAQSDEEWRFPNMQTNSGHDQHRPSVASTLLSATSAEGGTRTSFSHASSHSSNLLPERTQFVDASSSPGHRAITPVPTIEDAELLARTTFPPEPSHSPGRGFPGDAVNVRTPETSKSQHRSSGVRRSLQKTLREAHHHQSHQRHSSSHKHRRGKDSGSTVRSIGAANNADEDGSAEGAPGLAREKTRFILHGKQASVVQFGGDWERMRMRREQYEREHPASSSTGGNKVATTDEQSPVAPDDTRQSHEHQSDSRADALYPAEMLLQARAASPVVQDLRHSTVSSDADELDDAAGVEHGGDDDEDAVSFREDAHAAAFYAASDTYSRGSGSDRSLSFVSGPSDLDVLPHEIEDDDDDDSIDDDRRQTITGLASLNRDYVDIDPDVRHETNDGAHDEGNGDVRPKDADRRRTVLGPFPSNPHLAPASDETDVES